MLRPRTLRGRLALAFGVTASLFAVGFGLLIDVRLDNELREAVDAGLEARYEAVGAELLVASAASFRTARGEELLPARATFVQLVDDAGGVVAASPRALLDRPLLSGRLLTEARKGRVRVAVEVKGLAERARLLAGPGPRPDRHHVIVVGTSFDEAHRAHRQVQIVLAASLPALAGLVTVVAWLALGAALRPVDSMMREADLLSVVEAGQRLTIPTGGEELVRLAERLNALLARIEAAIMHERQFIDEASHELRTPIAIAKGELELARAVAEGDSEMAQSLDSALEEVDRLERLADDLLVLARSRSDAGRERRHRVDLAATASRAADAAARRVRREEVSATVVGAGEVLGDEQVLERALVNVIDNALRFARSEVTVTISPAAPGPDSGEGARVQVDVTDDGPGFPPNVLPVAFDRFTRSPRDAGGGTGLGLAIVAAIAASHGGTVSARNEPAGGATVTLLFSARPPVPA